MSGTVAGVPDGPDTRSLQSDVERTTPPVRLKSRADFVRAAKGGRVHSRCFSLQVFRRPDEADDVAQGRVGLTVTRKVGGAVERNRIKRRLREALRSPELAVLPGHDYVIVARRDALTARFANLLSELDRGFADAEAGRSRRPASRGTSPRGGASSAKRAPRRLKPATAP